MRTARSSVNRIRKTCIALLILVCLLGKDGSVLALEARAKSLHAASAVADEESNASEDGGQNGGLTVYVKGQFEVPDRQALIDRINEIRREACEEGVTNPADGEPLTPEDYVPLQWSFELEQVCVLRASESAVLRDHVRPDGTLCFTALPDSRVYSMETLAWGYGSTAEAVEGWYSEKEAYLEGAGSPAGHYIALITPANRYAAAADLRTDSGGDACAGAFGEYSEDGAEDISKEQETAQNQALSEKTRWEVRVTTEGIQAVFVQTLRTAARGMSRRRPGVCLGSQAPDAAFFKFVPLVISLPIAT